MEAKVHDWLSIHLLANAIVPCAVAEYARS